LKALGDADWRVRKEAVAVACRAAPSSEVLRGLIESIQPGSNVGLRNAAVEAISAFGADAVDAIAIALPNLDADGRKLATEALANCGHPAAFLILEGLARDDDTNVRATAIEAVARIGAAAPEAASAILLTRLKAEDRFERLAALDGLNQLGATLAWQQIEPMLTDPILARPALLAAGRSGNPRAAVPLTRALTTARGATFEAALVGLSDFVRTGEASEAAAKLAFKDAGPALEATLIAAASPKSDQLASRRMATLLLGCVETATAADVVVLALADDSVTAEAEEALLLMGPACVDAVVAGLNQADPEQRARGVELLARMFGERPSVAVVQAVLARLDDDDSHVVRVALEALAQLGDETTLESVAEKLVEASGAVRWSAETALAEIALRCPGPAQQLIERATPQGKDAVAAAVVLGALVPVRPLNARDEEFLTDVLAHESMFARRAALDALSTGKTSRAVDAVAFALTDEHREVQVAAIRTLGRMRDETGRPPGLAHLLPLVADTPDQELLAHAVAALGDAGSVEAVRALRPLTRTAPAPVAVSAIEAIVRIPEIRHVDELIDGLAHPSTEVVKAALGAISELNDPRVATHIGVCLDHEAWDVRRLAADLLGELGGESNVNLLRAKLQLEKEPLVKDALARALEGTRCLA
jgi:HEAT repeat protein